MRPRKACSILLAVALVPTAIASPRLTWSGESWPQFRGPAAAGTSDEPGLPVKWSRTENVVWAVDVPGRGWSSPVNWKGRVFLTTAEADGPTEDPRKGLYFGGDRSKPSEAEHRWIVLCLDLETGKVIWKATAHHGKPDNSLHIKNTYASETPLTDGERVYACFGNVGLFAYTVDGEPAWSLPLPARKTRNGWGTAASPALQGDRIILVNDNEEESFIAAIDRRTGKEVWKKSRDEKSNWSSPFIWKTPDRTEIVTAGSGRVRSYDLDGGVLWTLKGMSNICIPTPIAQEGLLYFGSGYVMDRLRPIYAIRPGAKGDISLEGDATSNASVAWCQRQAGPYNPSFLAYRGRIYVLLDRGFLSCYDAATGAPVYEKVRLGDEPRGFTASPWAYDGKIFCLGEEGDTLVVEAGPEHRVLGVNSLGDMCMATPAIVGKSLLLRTLTKLYRIETAKEAATAK